MAHILDRILKAVIFKVYDWEPAPPSVPSRVFDKLRVTGSSPGTPTMTPSAGYSQFHGQ
jgi:hypothetical protein